MILEAACDKAKSVMMINNPGLDGIKLGRGHECEIRIVDISVSRNHAAIKRKVDGFYIEDNKSKFGTLVRGEEVNQFELGKWPLCLQSGRTYIEIESLKNKSG